MRPYFSRFISCLAIILTIVIVQTTAAEGFKYLEVKVVDPEDKPLVDVPVEISIDGMKFPMPTDDEGMVAVNVPAGDNCDLELSVSHEGYAGIKARWSKGNAIPDTFTIPLKKGITIGGIVHDEQGKPIEGVKVEGIATAYNDYDNITGGKGELQPTIARELGTTDSSGRWENKAAPDQDIALQLRFSHPEYVSDKGFGYRGGTWEELKKGETIVVMQKGITLAGRITDGDGKPVAGAKVAVGGERYMSGRVVVISDEEGNYKIPNSEGGTTVLTVTAPGFSPELQNVAVHRGMPQADFKLAPGNLMRIKIVDKAGQPVAGARVTPDEWRGARSIEWNDRRETNEEGIWEWASAPSDEVQYSIYKSGNMSRKEALTASSDEHVVTLYPAVVVNGKVVDKETKQPIDKFKYVEGVWWEPGYDRYVLQSMNVEVGTGGQFRFQMESACEKFCVRVDADGYKPLVSREILPNEGEITVNFEMEAGSGPSGRVLTPEGAPAVGADVAMATPGNNQFLSNGRFQQHSQAFSVATDAEGKFALPVPEGPCRIVAVHDSGWAELEPELEAGPLEIKLTPWSTVTALSLRKESPVADEQISLSTSNRYERDKPYVSWNYNGMTNASGKLTFPWVRAGEVHVARIIPYAKSGRGSWMSASSHGATLNLSPGENATITLGGKGRHVKGRLTVAEKDRSLVDWNMGVAQLNGNVAGIGGGNENVFFSIGKLFAGSTATRRTTTHHVPKNYAAPINPDGEFEIFDVEPGNFNLVVQIYPIGGPENNRWNAIARHQESCVVPEGNDEETFDLGSFEITVVKDAQESHP